VPERVATSSGLAARKEGCTVRTILSIVYIVIGFVVAATHHYFVHLTTIRPIASAIFAVLLWPLVLFGVSLHLH